VRRRYARKLRRKARLRSKRLIRAFAEVPREHYLGPGPWLILTPRKGFAYHRTRDAHPRHIYDDVLVGIIPERWLNNGQPSGLARWLDGLDPKPGERVVHVGCGTGYYTAILAHVVGPSGKVTALEIDPELAARARANLAHLANVGVIEVDGSKHDSGPADAILINAGANYPAAVWLDSIRPGGRLVFPLITMHERWMRAVGRNAGSAGDQWKAGMAGLMFLATRRDSQFDLSILSSVGIFPCVGAIDRDADRRVAEALDRGGYEELRSLRRDRHDVMAACWLHGDDFCITR
jgi:protein-L-isoaspartate(D-aspartate) O-methyltransferase